MVHLLHKNEKQLKSCYMLYIALIRGEKMTEDLWLTAFRKGSTECEN